METQNICRFFICYFICWRKEDLHLSISDGFVKTKIYDKRDNFDFDIVNFPFLNGDVPRSTS